MGVAEGIRLRVDVLAFGNRDGKTFRDPYGEDRQVNQLRVGNLSRRSLAAENDPGRRDRNHTFVGHDSHGRYGGLDVELGRSQQYLGFPGDAGRVVGLWDSQPGSYFHAYVQHRWVVPVLLHCAWGMLWYGRHG